METYDAAALRHLSDGDHLFRDGRIDNADHLFGISAECAIKWKLMPQLTGEAVKTMKVHVDDLWRKSLRHLKGRQSLPLLSALKSGGEPFSDWRIDQRYQASGQVAPETAERHRKACSRVMGAVGLLAALK